MEFSIDGTFVINDWWRFGLAVVAGALSTRLILGLLRSLKSAHDNQSWREYPKFLGRTLTGFQPVDSSHKSEYGVALVLGIIEIGVYGPLMAANAWALVVSWVGLKTIAQWNTWTTDRSIFNIYLICTMLNIIYGYVVMRPLVTVVPLT